MEKKQTAVEFLLRELRIEDLAKSEQLSVVYHIINEAKAMEKEQIMSTYIDGADDVTNCERRLAEQYYNETYGSKESDEEKTNSQRFDEFMQLVTTSQTEISDEEIEKYAKSINPYPSTKQGSVDWENGFIRAIQWYKEQLKRNYDTRNKD